MVFEKLAEEQTQKFLGRVWEDAAGYLRLYDFAKLRAGQVFSHRPRPVLSVAEFWHGILGDRFSGPTTKYRRLRDGDVVRFRSGFLSDWAPKLPGQLWTATGAADLAHGLRSIEGPRRYGDGMYMILDPWGKRRVLNAGHGTVRTATAPRSPDSFAYMALVDEQNWNCDYGVPLVVSRPVFDLFKRYSEDAAPAIKSLEGVLRLGEDLPLSQLIPLAIGGELSKASEASLRYRPGLPKCYVHVVSPLSVRLLYNRSHPQITAWTTYETVGITAHREPLGYSYITMNPCDQDQHDEAANFLRHYARDHGGRRLITDYDGVVPRLNASIPLTANPIRRKRAAVRRWLRGIDQWAKHLLPER